MKSKPAKIIWFIGIIIYSIIIFYCLLFDNKDAFYVDDNIMQWGPVIRRGFDQIFAGRGIPYWNFYQYKGLDIFSSGYYGFLNPFMYVSYVIGRYVFNYNLETLIIYEWLLYCLGLCFTYILLNDLSLKPGTLIITLFSYSVSIIYFSHAFYYFSFNSYFFVPFLVWIFNRAKCKKYIWYVPGIILAFSLLMGHIQYTCYYIIVYLIIQIVFYIRNKLYNIVLPIISNITIFTLLSFFLLILSLSVSSNRSLILYDMPSEFLSEPISIQSILFPLSLAPISKFSNRREMEQYLGLGIFTYLALIPLIPLVKLIGHRIYRFLCKADQKYLNKLTPQKQIAYKCIFLVTLYFSAIRIFLNSVVPFHVFTELMIDSLLIICAIICYLISIKKSNCILVKTQTILIAIYLLIFGLIFLFPFFSYISLAVYYIYINRKQNFQLPQKQSLCYAVAFSAFFFIILCTGRENMLAYILSYIPFIKEFRFLYKCAFIFVPLINICGGISLDSIDKHSLLIRNTAVLCSFTSLISIIYIIHSGIHPYINNSFYDYQNYRIIENEINSQFTKYDINRNYRFLTFINPNYQSNSKYTKKASVTLPFWLSMDPDEIYHSNSRVSDDPRFFSSIEISSKICIYALTKNLDTFYGVFSIGGYDNIFAYKNFHQSDQLMKDMYLEGMMTNMSLQLNDLVYKLKKKNLDIFQKQMINNSIKYIIIDNSSTQVFYDIIAGCDKLSINRTIPWYRDYVLVEINGVLPICSYESNEETSLSSFLDKLCFTSNSAIEQQVNISMTFNNNYILKITNTDNNSTQFIPITESHEGYICATIPAGNYYVELIYQNRQMDMAVIFSLVTVILSALSVLVILFGSNSNKRQVLITTNH